MDPDLQELQGMGHLGAAQRTSALRGAVPRAVGVPADAAAEGERGEGEGVPEGAVEVP